MLQPIEIMKLLRFRLIIPFKYFTKLRNFNSLLGENCSIIVIRSSRWMKLTRVVEGLNSLNCIILSQVAHLTF